MTGRRQEIKERLQREFDICERHIMRIREALVCLNVQIPISQACYEALTEEQIRCIDQFIFRFSKLQDAIGAKIFRYILEILDEDVAAMPMRDVLNLLERYRLIASAEEWLYIRELRNEIAHDYPLMENELLSIINELISKTDTLIKIFTNLKTVAEKVE